jgi:hypothetical protein
LNINLDVLQDFYNNYHGDVPAYYNDALRWSDAFVNLFIERSRSLVEIFRTLEMSLLLRYILNRSFRDLDWER